MDNIGSLVTLPEHEQHRTKDLFIVNFQVPNYAPSNPLWGDKQGDGPGFNLVMYFWIPPNIRRQLDGEEEITVPQVKLLAEFMAKDSTIVSSLPVLAFVRL